MTMSPDAETVIARTEPEFTTKGNYSILFADSFDRQVNIKTYYTIIFDSLLNICGKFIFKKVNLPDYKVSVINIDELNKYILFSKFYFKEGKKEYLKISFDGQIVKD